MAKDGKQAVSRVSKPPANEFFRGDERQFEGGDKAIISPVGSIFDAVSVSSTNAMEKTLSEQNAGRVVGRQTGGK